MREILKIEDANLAYEEAAMDAYQTRVMEYSDPNTGVVYQMIGSVDRIIKVCYFNNK